MPTIGKRREAGELRPVFTPLDRALARLHLALFVRRKAGSVAASALLYALVVLVLGERLAISSNYFVFLPLLAAALAYGLPGGLLAGLLGLPANLLLFALIGRPDFSPASKPIAWIFGAAVGLSLGYLSDYFRKLELEAKRRAATAASLAKALEEKEILLAELHHRVKNNLNVIKSLVQLQKNRSRDPAFIAAADDLMGRILSIALVHERLYGEGLVEAIEPRGYLEALVADILKSRTEPVALSCDIEAGGGRIHPDAAMPIALIVNEAVTNALKHGFEGKEERRIALSLGSEGESCVLAVEDDGLGRRADAKPGLGTKLIASLASQMGGSCSYGPAVGLATGDPARPGTRLELRFARAAGGSRSAADADAAEATSRN